MNRDQQGHTLSGADAASLECYHRAIEAFNLYRGDPVALLDRAISAAPEFAMAQIFKATLFALSTEPEATAGARQIIGQCASLSMNERERSFAGAVELLAGGDWPAASSAFNRHSMNYPLDILALQTGHLIDFYAADSRNMPERIARALRYWDESVPGYPVVKGMVAFGLEESGDYVRAEDAGREAVCLEPYDCWGHHAVAHVMEMQNRPQDGIGWMITREPFWSEDNNFFKVHNWWHRAVFHLDLGQLEQAVALYDGPVREGLSDVALDMVDASALLWRISLAGGDAGDRWAELAAAWRAHADGETYPFNDWHAAMAYLGAGETGEVDQLLRRMRAAAQASPIGDWIGRIGVPLVEGFRAYWQADYRQAVEKLIGVRRFSGLFGGSHAQRDIIDLTLIESATRAGDRAVSQALANERLAVRPYSHMSRGFLRTALGLADQQAPAVAAFA